MFCSHLEQLLSSKHCSKRLYLEIAVKSLRNMGILQGSERKKAFKMIFRVGAHKSTFDRIRPPYY